MDDVSSAECPICLCPLAGDWGCPPCGHPIHRTCWDQLAETEKANQTTVHLTRGKRKKVEKVAVPCPSCRCQSKDFVSVFLNLGDLGKELTRGLHSQLAELKSSSEKRIRIQQAESRMLQSRINVLASELAVAQEQHQQEMNALQQRNNAFANAFGQVHLDHLMEKNALQSEYEVLKHDFYSLKRSADLSPLFGSGSKGSIRRWRIVMALVVISVAYTIICVVFNKLYQDTVVSTRTTTCSLFTEGFVEYALRAFVHEMCPCFKEVSH